MSRKKNMRRLSILVTAQTLYNLHKERLKGFCDTEVDKSRPPTRAAKAQSYSLPYLWSR